MSKLCVAVIFGGASNEHDISLVSATNIINAIPRDAYEVVCIGITKKGRWLFYPGGTDQIASGEWQNNPDNTPAIISPDPMHRGIIKIEGDSISYKRVDVVFPVMHGRNGEDGAIQGLLELARLPVVGVDLIGSAICIDKALTHTVLEAAGIRTARWKVICQSELSSLDERCAEIAASLSFPLFVKPAGCGSSIGINKATDEESLKASVKLAFSHYPKVIIEEFISGRELECAVLGNEKPIASTVGEIVSGNDFYDYEAKYILASSRIDIPASVSVDKIAEIRATAIEAYKAVGASGLSRIDFFLTEEGTVYLNEINTMPGFTPISMYSKLMEYEGIDTPELVDRLITLALEKSI